MRFVVALLLSLSAPAAWAQDAVCEPADPVRAWNRDGSVLTVQTLLGAARMLDADPHVPAAELRRRVTSPGGTTQAALDSFAADGFAAMVQRAVHAARLRGAELSAAHDEAASSC